MLELTIYIFFVLIFFWLPGEYWLRKLKLPAEGLSRCGLSLVIGVTLFIFLTLIVRMIGLPFYVLSIYGVINIILGIQRIKKLHLSSSKKTILSFFIELLIILVTSFFLAGNAPKAYIDQAGIHLPAARDTFWRLSIVGELISHFPPQHPGFAGELLKNYHFLYDLLVAATHVLTRVDAFLLYTQLYTYFSSLLMVCSILLFLKTFLKNMHIVWFGTVLTVFTGNLSYVLPWLSNQYDFVARANVFMSDQPFDQSHNPFNLLAYALFITGLVLFKYSQKNPRIIILLGFLMPVLLGVKIYAGLILFLAVGTAWIFQFIQERKISSVWQVAPLILALPVFLVLKGKSFGILAYNPGWVLTKMIQDQDRLHLSDMILKEEHYMYMGNYMRVIQYKLMQLGIYFLGNLNIRIIGLFACTKKIIATYFQRTYIILLGSAIVYALGIPLFFSQNRGVYDSIQFTPYGLLILSLLTAVVLDYAWTRYVKRRTTIYMAAGVGIVLFIIGSSTNLLTQIHWRVGYQDISRDELDALLFLRQQTDPDVVILTDLSSNKMTHMYVSAISQRRTYLSGVALAQQIGLDTDKREETLRKFFAEPELDRNFLPENHISYIYLSDEGLVAREKMRNLGFTEIFGNTSASIFKVL